MSRDPSGVEVIAKVMRLADISATGVPSAFANWSSTANDDFGSISRNSHEPNDSSPRGLVILYCALPPTSNAKSVKVEGYPGGPQNRSS